MDTDGEDTFQLKYNELEQQIIDCKASPHLAQLQAQINQLSTQDISNLSKYKQKSRINQFQQLSKLVHRKSQELVIPQFQFVGQPLPKKISFGERNVQTNQPTQPVTSTTTNILSDLSFQNLTQTCQQILISNITSSILNITSKSINFKGGDNNLIVFNSAGSIFIHDLTHSVLVVECHQLRLHKVTDCVIINRAKSVVIENCHGLQFSGANNINDFNYPKQGDNPNYKNIEPQQVYSQCMSILKVTNGDVQQEMDKIVKQETMKLDKISDEGS